MNLDQHRRGLAPKAGEITQVLAQIEAGDQTAKARLLELSYGQLLGLANVLMKSERRNHTLDPTELVHEAMLRIEGDGVLHRARHRGYFYGAMARAMRQTLVDHARRRNAQRRGGRSQRVPLDDPIAILESSGGIELLDLDEALTRLEQLSPRQAEIVERRLFAGQPILEVATQLGVSSATVKKDWLMARAWLRLQLSKEEIHER